MAVTVGVDSYIDEAELTTYAGNRGITLTGDPSVLLIKAMDYLESQSFIGVKTDPAQALQWPRSEAYIDGVLIDPYTVPQEVKDAQAVIAVSIEQGFDPLATYGRAIKRRKTDVLETEYMDGARDTSYSPNITRALEKIVTSGSGSGFIEIGAYR